MTRSAAPTPLRASPSRAAAQLGAAPLRQCSPTSPGPAAVLGASQGRKSIEAQGLYEKNSALRHAKDEIRQRPARPVFIGLPRRRSARLSWPLEGAEQRRGGREKGEHCLRAAGPSCAAPARPESRRGPAQRAPTRGRLFFADFLLAKQKKAGRASGAERSARGIHPRGRKNAPCSPAPRRRPINTDLTADRSNAPYHIKSSGT